MPPLPRIRCTYAGLPPLAADPANPFWQGIEPVTLRENVTGQAPGQETCIRTAWNDAGWRILFEMGDANPWATLTERDGPLWNEEVAEVFIDPVGDLEGYFEVEINPLGTVVDLVLRRTKALAAWRSSPQRAGRRNCTFHSSLSPRRARNPARFGALISCGLTGPTAPAQRPN